MHILKSSSPITTPGGVILPAGEWLLQDSNAFELALMADRGTVELSPWTNQIWDMVKSGIGQNGLPAGVHNESVQRVLIIRSGAIGDLLLFMPCLPALHAAYPNASITLSCFERHHAIFQQEHLRLDEYPIRKSVAERFDLVIPLENIVELSTDKGQHATDAYAEALGVTVTDYKPVYKVTEEEKAFAIESYGTGKKRIALQLHASTPIRDYPMQNWMAVMQELIKRGWEIMLLGNKDSIQKLPPEIKDCSGLTFREAAAVLATCDVFCGVDSAFFNLCPALGIPAVGLFGPVDWRTRIKVGGNTGQVALHGEADCCPCNWTNSRNGRRFPAHGPCATSGRCDPLAGVSPGRIVSVIEREAGT